MIGPGSARRWSAMAVCLVATVLCACRHPSPKATSTSISKPKSNQYYVSLGDSYAAGFEPTGPGGVGATTINGFAYQVPGLASARGYHLTLVNYGCGGATTASILQAHGCSIPGPGAPSYPDQSQASAAEGFLAQHRGGIGLVTVSIGGNDLITDCISSTDPVGCVTKGVTTIYANLAVLLPALRTAAGPGVPIQGLTYPDVVLGNYLSSVPATRALAPLSVTSFMDVVNPALQKQYESVGATFVDVTSGTGAYIPFAQTTRLAPYGTIPVAVARICQYTFYCQYGDIHPRTVGYTQIATLITAALPAR